MIWVTSWISLALLTVVVSQPLFYSLALGRATRQLGPSAYVELRQQINATIARPFVRLYIATLVSLLALVAGALIQAARLLALGAATAGVALIVDAVLAAKLNVPINARMDGWSVANVPSDWQTQRAHWDHALAIRRVVLLAGYAALTLALTART